MKHLLKNIAHGLNPMVLRELPDYFDAHERRLMVQSVIIGAVVWGIVFLLKLAVHGTLQWTIHFLENQSSVLMVFVPLLIGAGLVAAIARYTGKPVYYHDDKGKVHELIDVEGDGLERAISLYHASEPSLEQALLGREGVAARWEMPTWGLVIRKFLATLITMGSGGSGGLEASVTLIGESVAAGLFKPHKLARKAVGQVSWVRQFWNWWRPLNADDLQTAQLCGVAAAVSTLLGAPLAAAFFATEVMYRRRPIIEKLIYSLIASLVAFFLSTIFAQDHVTIFVVEDLFVPPTTLPYYISLLVLSLLIAIVSIYFARLRIGFEDWFHHRQPNIWKRHLLGAFITGSIVVIVAMLLPLLIKWGWIPETGADHLFELVLGPGEELINFALAGKLAGSIALIALIAKMPATLATVSSGGSAGLLVPSIFFGVMVATIMGSVLSYFGYSLPVMVFIVPGIAASLVSIVNVPLAAILFTVEIFGARYLIPVLITLVITIFTHDNTIYRSQRDAYQSRQILPGYSVRRISVPHLWEGKTLADLQFRQRFNLTVIGLMEQHGDEGIPQVRLGIDATNPLEVNDVIVVIGQDAQLDYFEQSLFEFVEQTEADADESEISEQENEDKG